jgi:hypothetical protein
MSWISTEELNTVSEIIKHTAAQKVRICSTMKTKMFVLTKQDTLREVFFLRHINLSE